MKKGLLLTFVACCVSTLSYAAMSNMSAQDSVLAEKAKFAFAKVITRTSLESDSSQTAQDLLRQMEEIRCVSELDSLLKTKKVYTRNQKIVEQIGNIQIESICRDSINNRSIAQFVEIETAKGELKTFFTKRTDTAVEIKSKVVSAIEKALTLSRTIALTSLASEKKERQHTGILWSILKWLLLLLLIGTVIYLFYLYRLEMHKSAIFIDKNNNKRERLESLQAENEKLKSQIASLKVERDNLLRERKSLETSNNRESVVEPRKIVEAPEPIVPQEKVYYLGAPADGEFTTQYESYRQGKALYKLVTKDGENGLFEFICLPETINIVRNSKTMFLEPACQIENNVPTFSKISMVSHGNAQLINDSWKIINKATIRLD